MSGSTQKRSASTRAAKAKNTPQASTSIARHSRFMVEFTLQAVHSNCKCRIRFRKSPSRASRSACSPRSPELAPSSRSRSRFTRAEMLDALRGADER